MSVKYVYRFQEGDRQMSELLGGKGANLAELTRLLGSDQVPGGFTVTTEACAAYFEQSRKLSPGVMKQVADALEELEVEAGRRFADSQDPLLVSVRSGAPVSMPGMMDTVLNLGLTDASVEGLAKVTSDPHFAWDSYRRFVQMYGNVVRAIPNREFEAATTEIAAERGLQSDSDLDADALKQLTEKFKLIYRDAVGGDFPQDPTAQLRETIGAVFNSWYSERAVSYRRINQIPDHWGTAVNIQQMVFGNRGDSSGSGVAFSRDERSGEPSPSGDYLVNAQGEDVVAGTRDPLDLSDMEARFPQLYQQLVETLRLLENHYRDMQDVEFTFEQGHLYFLQTRSAKRPARAAVRVAVDLVEEGLTTKRQSLRRLEVQRLEALLHPTFDPKFDVQAIASGVNASPGAAKGEIVFTVTEAVDAAAQGRDVILVRPFTEADDVAGFDAAKGIITVEGGKASHAALVARGMGRPCITGVSAFAIDLEKKLIRVGDRTLHAGEILAIDGESGIITDQDVPLVATEIDNYFETVLIWADEIRRLGVRANADTPVDAQLARRMGAEGIGLCRTEHMFMSSDRQPKMKEMILAKTAQQRQTALAELLPLQEADFEGILQKMAGLPVTIRLLDPPLHEFLPREIDLELKLQQAKAESDQEVVERLYVDLERVRQLQEVNPMLGTRGCRLALLYPEVYEMQVEAIAKAALNIKVASGVAPNIEIMIPLVAYEGELELLRELVARSFDRFGGGQLDYKIGTMIELPRACLIADKIAPYADFFSFGTNDLTQTTAGLSRDDAEGGFLQKYIDRNIIDRSPFETLDREGVGALILTALEKISSVDNLKTGVCGEQGGDPSSIDFFHDLGIDYVSCSPYRVPIARVAAAQAVIRDENIDEPD